MSKAVSTTTRKAKLDWIKNRPDLWRNFNPNAMLSSSNSVIIQAIAHNMRQQGFFSPKTSFLDIRLSARSLLKEILRRGH